MSKFILDSSAFLALINKEEGSEIVANLLKDTIISSVNVAEIVAKLVEQFNMAEEDIEKVLNIGFEEKAFDHKQAALSGIIRNKTKKLGLSLGDRACLALGISLGLPVLTADKNWSKIEELDLVIKIIR